MKDGFGPEEKDLHVIVKGLVTLVAQLDVEVKQLSDRVDVLEGFHAVPEDITPPTVEIVRPG